MPATTDTLEALTSVSDVQLTDILHLMRDPDLPGRIDRKISAAALMASIVSGRPPGDMYAFSGVNGAVAYIAMGAVGAIGAGDFTIVVPDFEVPTTAVPGDRAIVGTSADATMGLSANSVNLWLKTTEQLMFGLRNPAGTQYRQFSVNNFRLLYMGQRGPLVVTLAGESLAIYFKGAPLTAVVSGSPDPAQWSGVKEFTYFGANAGGGDHVRTTHGFPLIANQVLTPTEVLTHAQTGRFPNWWELCAGSAVASYTSNFSVDNDGWNAVRSTVSGNVDGITDGTTNYDDVLKCYCDAVNATHAVSRVSPHPGGARLRVTGKYYIPAGQTNVNGVAICYSEPAGYTVSSQFSVVGTWTSFDVILTTRSPQVNFLATKAGVIFFVGAANANDDRFYLRDLVIYPQGPISKPGLQDGTYQGGRDMGANGVDVIHTAGVLVMVDGKRRPQVRAKSVNVGTAAYLIQSADILLPGWDVDCIQITNNAGASAVDVKVQLSDGTNHTDLMAIATITAGATSLFYPSVGGLDTRRRLRCVAASGATDLTFNFSLRKRS